jgi:N-acyl-L-homoserine lactone synthetase
MLRAEDEEARAMVHVVTAENRDEYAAALAGMHRDRRRVFVDRLGWDVPVVDSEYEIDQFDTEYAIYLLDLDAEGRHQGSIRLLPTTRPHLLSDVFPHLCEKGAPSDPQTWEITRLCTSPDAHDPKGTGRRLTIAVTEFALLYGLRRYSCMTHLDFLSRVLAVGWDCEPLGLPQADDKGLSVGAIVINMTPETLSLVRARTGSTTPVLYWNTRRAA